MHALTPDPHPIVVHAHGPVVTADHVYAHNQVARFHRMLGDRRGPCVVDLVDPGQGTAGDRHAEAELHVDGVILHAEGRGPTMRTAVNDLAVELRRQVARLEEPNRITTGSRTP